MAQEVAKLLIVCNCGQKMKVPANAIGKTVNCVNCASRITITRNAVPPPDDPVPESFENEDSSNSNMPPLDDSTDLLLNNGLIDQASLDKALLVQRDLPGTVWSILIDMGYLESEKFHTLMAKEEGIANIELENYTVPDDVVSILPEDLIRKYYVIPVDKLGKLLTLAMVCPHNQSVIKEAENITGLRVKIMLCTYDAMKGTIKSKLPYSKVDGVDSVTLGLAKEFENILNEKIVARRIFRQNNLLPSSTELSQLQDIPDNDVVQLAQVSSTNPVFLGKVLQLANSAAYGMAGKVTSFAQAAALIGPDALRKSMHSDECIDYKKQHKTFDMGNYLKRSRFCAVSAKMLATEVGSTEADTASTIGLLFEIGRLILLQALPNSYTMATRDEIGMDLYEIESRLYQFPYTEAGYYMLRKWNLPHSILEPIRYQVQPKQSNQESHLTNILFLAIVMTKAFANNEPLHIRTDEEDALHSLGTTPEKFESIYQACYNGF